MLHKCNPSVFSFFRPSEFDGRKERKKEERQKGGANLRKVDRTDELSFMNLYCCNIVCAYAYRRYADGFRLREINYYRLNGILGETICDARSKALSSEIN